MVQQEAPEYTHAEAIDRLYELANHPGWQLIMAQLRAEHDTAIQALAHADLSSPESVTEARKLQDDVRRYTWFGETRELIMAALRDDEKVAESETPPYED